MSPPEYTPIPRGRTLLFALTVVVFVGCLGLGTWQLNRLRDRKERNRVALAERDLPEVDLNRASLPAGTGYRSVRVTGRYAEGEQFLLRNRVLRGTPGIQVVTPLLIEGRDTVVLVNRGFVPTPDAGAPPAGVEFGEPGNVVVTGVAVSIPDDGDGNRLETPNGATWHRLDLTALRRRLPYPVAPFYVIAAATAGQVEHTLDGRRYPMRVAPPPLDDGPHLSYAIQWFLIGGAALGFGVVFVRRRPEPSPVPD